MRTIIPLLLALLATGCAAEPEGASSESSRGQLVVRRVQPEGPIAVEGSVSFARIEAEDGAVVAEEGFDAPDHGTDAGTYGYPEELELGLEPGTYTLISYQRACDAACDSLDPPDERYTCRHRFEAEPNLTLTADVGLSASGCQIELSVISP